MESFDTMLKAFRRNVLHSFHSVLQQYVVLYQVIILYYNIHYIIMVYACKTITVTYLMTRLRIRTDPPKYLNTTPSQTPWHTTTLSSTYTPPSYCDDDWISKYQFCTGVFLVSGRNNMATAVHLWSVSFESDGLSVSCHFGLLNSMWIVTSIFKVFFF